MIIARPCLRLRSLYIVFVKSVATVCCIHASIIMPEQLQAENEMFSRFFVLSEQWQQKPLMWHVVTMKWLQGSPIREAHMVTHGAHSSYDLQWFYDWTERYFFAPQNLTLQRALQKLFFEEYRNAWLPLLLMGQPKSEEGTDRLLKYWQTPATWRLAPCQDIAVEVKTGLDLHYGLLMFVPVDEQARIVQQQLLKNVKKKLLFFPEQTVDENTLAEYAGIA